MPNNKITKYWKHAKPYVGRAASTALGFALGNTAGAVGGYNAYKGYEKLTETMGKRKRSGGNKPNKRRKAVKAKPRAKKATQYGAGVKKYKAKGVRVARKRVAPMSQKFRKQVLAAVEAPKTTGVYRQDYLGGVVAENAVLLNRQFCFNDCQGVLNGNWLFKVDDFINASSVLWNGAVRTVAQNVAFHGPQFAGRWSESWNMKLHIKTSSCYYEVTNTSLRTVHLQVVECKPKHLRSFEYGTQANQWGFNAATHLYASAASSGNSCHNPLTEWVDSLTSDQGTDSVSRSTSGAFLAQTVELRGNHPNKSNGFRSEFVANTLIDLKLEPGQTYNFSVAGPANYTLDMEKYHNDLIYCNLDPKFTRGIIFIAKTEQVRGATAGAGYMADADAQALLAISRQDNFTITCPERVPETEKKKVYVWDEIVNTVAAEGLPERPTDENIVAV